MLSTNAARFRDLVWNRSIPDNPEQFSILSQALLLIAGNNASLSATTQRGPMNWNGTGSSGTRFLVEGDSKNSTGAVAVET